MTNEALGSETLDVTSSSAIDRRHFLRALIAVASAPALFAGCVDDTTAPIGPTTVSLPLDQIAQQAAIQQCPEWCWAASASMIFGFLGHPISQQAIVQRTYGIPICAPANNSTTMGRALSGTYIDAAGRPFNSQVTAGYDYENGINAINNQYIIESLKAGFPLLYGNFTHAMVVCALTYTGTVQNPTVTSVTVIDPWPFNSRLHELSQAEMVPATLGGAMMFLAAVRVS